MRTLKLVFTVLVMMGAVSPVLGGAASAQDLPRIGGLDHGAMFGLALDGTTAYVGNGLYLQRLDVSDPSEPVLLSELKLPGLPLVIRRADDYVYVQTPDAGFRVIDVSDPITMEEVDSYDFYEGTATGMAMSGETAVITGSAGLLVLGVYDYNNPIGRSTFPLDTAIDVAIKGNAAYIFDDNGVSVMEIDDPDHPLLHDPIPLLPISHGGDKGALCTDGDRLYVLYEKGIRALDISDPTDPDTLGYTNSGFVGTTIGAGNNLVYISTWHGLNIYDFTTPNIPIWRWTYDWGFTGHHCAGFAVDGDTAYYANTYEGLSILNVTDPMAVTREGLYPVMGTFTHVARDGDVAALAGFPRIRLFDMSDPAAPGTLGALPAGLDNEYMQGMLLRDDHLYVLWRSELRVFDVEDPAAPTEVYHYPSTVTMNTMTFDEDAGVLIAAAANSLLFFDVSDPGSITLQKTVEIETWAYGLIVHDGYLFVQGWASVAAYPLGALEAGSGTITPCGSVSLAGPYTDSAGFVLEPVENRVYVGREAGQIDVVDIADPCALQLAGGTTFMPTVTGIARCRSLQDGPGLLVLNTIESGSSYVTLFDVSDPATPVELAVNNELVMAEEMALWDDELIVTTGPMGFHVLDTSPFTPVTLASFGAERRGGEVVVRWELARADDRSSFFVYRETGDGALERLHDSPLHGGARFEYVDRTAPEGVTVYRLEELDAAGGRRWLGSVTVAAADGIARRPVLHPAAPNPFAPRTTITFDLPAAGAARVAVYDIGGRLVKVLLDGPQPAGLGQAEWDGRDDAGRAAASGVYFIELRAAGETQRRKVVLAR